MRKKRKDNYYLNRVLVFLLIVFAILFLFFVFSGDDGDLDGELNSLKWESDGVGVELSKRDDGGVQLHLQSAVTNVQQGIDAVTTLKEGIDVLIQNMKNRGAPVDDSSYNVDFDISDLSLTIDFDETVTAVIMNGTLVFLDQAAEYCQGELVDDVILKLESDSAYELNKTSANCELGDIPDILRIVSFAQVYANITQSQDFDDLTLIKNQNAVKIINLNNHFHYVGSCNFSAFSQGGRVGVSIEDDRFVSFNPDLDYVGNETVFVDVQCNDVQDGDNFNVEIRDVVNVSGNNLSNSSNNLINGSLNVNSSIGGFESNLSGFGSSGSGDSSIVYSPARDKLYLDLDDSESFSVSSGDYDSIEWHLNGKKQTDSDNSFRFDALEEGKFVVKVIVKKGLESDSNTWVAIVEEDIGGGSSGSGNSGSGGSLVLFLIIGVGFLIFIIVGIIVWRKMASKKAVPNNNVNRFGPPSAPSRFKRRV